MSVKRSQSGARVLNVLEAIADYQPIGTRALARALGEDKSAIHRALMTLADQGWIRPSLASRQRWEVAGRLLAVAEKAQGLNDLKRRARPALERLRDDCGETVVLMVVKAATFVIADVVESRHTLRMVPDIGLTVAAERSAIGRAVLPFLERERQLAFLGKAPDEEELRAYAIAREQGYAVSAGETDPAATSIGAPIAGFDQRPCGAVVVTGPRHRLTPETHALVGARVVATASALSRAELGRE